MSASQDDDEMILVVLAVLALPAALGAATVAWRFGSAWLVAHGVLVAAAASPLVPVPGMGGAGLDLARVCITGGVVLLLAVAAVSGARSLKHHKETR